MDFSKECDFSGGLTQEKTGKSGEGHDFLPLAKSVQWKNKGPETHLVFFFNKLGLPTEACLEWPSSS